jgi:hypothetical protein
MALAVLTLAVDFWQLTKVLLQACTQIVLIETEFSAIAESQLPKSVLPHSCFPAK